MFITIVGVIILIACAILLLAPIFGWRFKYNATEPQVTVDIPKAGAYTFFVSRSRGIDVYGKKREVNFSIAIFDARDETQLISQHSMFTTTSSGGYERIKVGEFSAPFPGKFSIVSLAESRFMEKDKIIIRKRVSRIKQLLLIIGILISPYMFTTSLAGGLISFGGLLLGIIILGFNL